MTSSGAGHDQRKADETRRQFLPSTAAFPGAGGEDRGRTPTFVCVSVADVRAVGHNLEIDGAGLQQLNVLDTSWKSRFLGIFNSTIIILIW